LAQGPDGVLNEVVWAEEQQWEPLIRKHVEAGDIAGEARWAMRRYTFPVVWSDFSLRPAGWLAG